MDHSFLLFISIPLGFIPWGLVDRDGFSIQICGLYYLILWAALDFLA